MDKLIGLLLSPLLSCFGTKRGDEIVVTVRLFGTQVLRATFVDEGPA
jgi:hypothetical protein